jgi:hypothetical protein
MNLKKRLCIRQSFWATHAENEPTVHQHTMLMQIKYHPVEYQAVQQER